MLSPSPGVGPDMRLTGASVFFDRPLPVLWGWMGGGMVGGLDPECQVRQM